MIYKGINSKLIVVLLLGILTITPACKTSEKIPNEAKQAENADLQAQKDAEKEYELAVKHHYKMQSIQTKKSMKELKKQQRKLNRSKKRSLWDQIFNNNCDKPVDVDTEL